MPFVVFRRDHLRFTSGITCGSGSFAVQFGDHLRSGDHLRPGIICGAVQDSTQSYTITYQARHHITGEASEDSLLSTAP